MNIFHQPVSFSRLHGTLWLTGFLLCGIAFQSKAQLTVTTQSNAQILAQSLVGAGVTVTNAVLTCDSMGAGTFVATAPSVLGMGAGIVLTSGDAVGSAGSSNTSTGYTGPAYTPGDPDLDGLTTAGTNDACALEFDIFITADTLRFNYIFGSEEYNYYTCSGFNDVFGFFISGPGIVGSENIAIIPGTSLPVTINNVNCCSPYSSYYVCNDATGDISGYCVPTCQCTVGCPSGPTDVQLDGYTTVLTAEKVLTPCEQYHLKLAVADVSDHALDSGVFIEQGSLTSVGVQIIPTATYVNPINNQPTAVEGCVEAIVKVRLSFLPTDTVNIPLQISGDAQFGIDYTYGGSSTDSITFAPNDSVEYISIIPIADGISEPMESIMFIYQPQFCASAPLDTVILNISDFMEAQTSPDAVMCLNNPITLTVNGGDSIDYAWTPATGLSCTDCQSPDANPTVTTTYYVTISAGSSASCTASDSVIVTVVNVFADAGPDQNLCLGDTLTLSTPAVSGLSYEWSPDYALSCSSCASTQASPGFTTDYIIHTYASVCNAYDTITVNVTVPVADAGPDLDLCYGDSLLLQTTTQNSQMYQWTPLVNLACDTCSSTLAGPLSTTTYTVTASLGTCSTSDSVVVNVHQVFADAGPDVSICPWFDTTLVASGGSTYQWSPPTGLSNPTSAMTVAAPMVTTTYLLTASSSGFVCSDVDTVVVTVLPFTQATISNDTIICFGQEANLLAGGGVSYQWGPLVEAQLYLSNDTVNNPIATPYDSTTFTVIVTDSAGCKDTASTTVGVYPDPYISVSGPHFIYKGESVTLNATGGTTYSWLPDSTLLLASTAEPEASPGVTTTYTVTMTTGAGCIYEREVVVFVQGETFIIAPNAFSPNGDGTNDRFNFIVRGIFTLQNFSIFDRWGERVFTTNDMDTGWDGTFNGKPAQLGVYVYMIQGTDVNNQTLVKSGNLLLLR